jgi:hypothetical protein
MLNDLWSRRWGVGVLVAAMFAAAGTVVLGQDRPDLSGEWRLNADLTARARALEVEREPNLGRRLPVGANGGPMGIGSAGRGPTDTGGGRRSSEESAKAREGFRLAALVPERLTVVKDGNAFVVTDAAGVSQRLTPDGKATKTEVGALTVETKTKWDGTTLVVERKFEGGVKASDRYSLTADPRRLTIATRIENTDAAGERPRTLHRVYDGS